MLTNPRPSDEMPPEPLKPLDWPFPSKDNPLRPWTPEQVKEYNQQHQVPDALM